MKVLTFILLLICVGVNSKMTPMKTISSHKESAPVIPPPPPLELIKQVMALQQGVTKVENTLSTIDRALNKIKEKSEEIARIQSEKERKAAATTFAKKCEQDTTKFFNQIQEAFKTLSESKKSFHQLRRDHVVQVQHMDQSYLLKDIARCTKGEERAIELEGKNDTACDAVFELAA